MREILVCSHVMRVMFYTTTMAVLAWEMEVGVLLTHAKEVVCSNVCYLLNCFIMYIFYTVHVNFHTVRGVSPKYLIFSYALFLRLFSSI